MRISRLLLGVCSVLPLSLHSLAYAACVPPPSGVLSWWPAEGDLRDAAGTADGVLMNGATFASGFVGQAFSLNGTNAYVRLPDNLFPFPPTTPASTPFSFEAWFKTAAGGVVLGQQIGVPFASVSGWVPGIYVGTDGKLNVQVFWTGGQSLVVSTQSVADNVFHHVAVTYDGAAEAVYLDGQLLNSRAFTPVSYGSAYSYQLGIGYTSGWADGNGGWFPFKGLIDEPALYNRALSSNEVATIYLAGAAGKCGNSLPPVITQPPATLEAPINSTLALNVGVRGAAPLSYQWQFYGTNLPAGTNAALVLSNIVAAQTGPYSVFISNAFGTAQSGTGVVTVDFPLVLDAAVSNGAPFAGAGNLEAPGAQDVYTFDAPDNRLVYFQVNTAFNRLFWSLTAPDGAAVFTGRYMPNNDVRRVELPMHGKYRLVTYNDSGITGAYGFSVSALTDQTFAISVGDTVTNGVPAAGAGYVEMSGSWDDYLFTAPGNGVVYFNVLSAFNRLFWTLFAPDGSAVFSQRYMPNNDVGRLQLPTAVTYRLRVYNDDVFTGGYSFKLSGDVDQVFTIAVGDTVTNGAPAAGAGNLETAGTWDDYTFTAPANRLVYFDVLSAPFRVFWSLYAPDGSSAFSGRYMPNNDVGRVALAHAGTYRLRVYSDNASTGTYSFRLTGITNDAAYNIAVGDTVTNGLPAPGAGKLEVPGTYDDYFFDASGTSVVYFAVLSAPFRLFWSLAAPDGSTVFSGRYMPNNDVRRVEMPMPGIYRLRVYSDTDATGSYSFRLGAVLDQTINLAVGTLVTNGVPFAGAGNLETPGAYDDYLFAAPANRVVFLNVRSAPYRLFWTLYGPDGSVPFSAHYMPNSDVGRVDLPVAGIYRLRVYSDTDSTGPYSFSLSNVVDQAFTIAIGSVVTNGVPAAGAGVLQSAGSDDLYTFTANAGQSVRFSDHDSSPRAASWRVVAPNGTQLFNDNLNGSDPGTFTLPATGTYNLHVRNNSTQAPVTYSFALVDNGTNSVSPPATDHFNIAIGDTVTNGIPAPGAGNIETAGALDIYTFTSGVGQVVFFEDRGSLNNQLRYDVYDSQWNPLFGEGLNNSQDLGRRTLDRGVAYYLVAGGNSGTATGTYSFKIWPVADQTFLIALGATVSNGVPAVGAGNLETPGVHDVYTFTAAPGQSVYFEDRGATPNGQIRYDVYDDRGTALFGEWLNGGQDIGRRTLARGGAYTIIVSGNANTVGTYSFKLWPIGSDQSFAINLGDTVSDGVPAVGAGNIETAGVQDIYTFTVAPGQEVYFEDRGATPSGNIRYDVYDPEDNYLFGEWLNGGQDIGRQTLVSGGTYKLVVSGYANVTGTYSFKLWPVLTDQSFALNTGDTLTNGSPSAGAGNIESPGARDIYTFTAPPGQVVFFEDRGATPSGDIRYDIYDDRGVYVMGEWLNSGQDIGRQTLARGGTYTLIASGYANYTGTYSLKIWPVSDQTFGINIGDVVTNGVPTAGAGNIETPGVHDVYSFTASPEQLVYFEDRGASNNGNIRYDVYDSNRVLLFGEWLNNGQEVGLRRLSLGGTYYVVASGYVNVTGTYSLRIWDALPHILQQPLSARGTVGQPQTFSVSAENPYKLAYQWRLYGTNMPGATNAILSLPNPTLGQAGPYDVVISNPYGAVTSAVAMLTLDTAELYVSAFSPSGPVATNVGQLLVQFNSPILANSFVPGQVGIAGPSGPLNSGAFTIVPVDAQTFLVNLPAQAGEGVYTVTIGPAITNQAGASMTGGALFPLYKNDFESGAGSAWSRGETISNVVSSRFLGEFSNDTATLLLAGLPPHSQLRLSWDALIIDTWDGNLSPGPDYFGFNIAGLPQPAWEYTFHSSGNPQVQSYPGTPDLSGVNFTGLVNPDSIYRNLQFNFAHTNDTLEVGFYGRNLQGVNDEGWGIDNVRIFVSGPANGVFNGRFVIDKTGPLVTGIVPSGTNVLPINSLTVSFNEPIQAQTFTTNDVLLTDPFGRAIQLSAPVRLSATNFQISFAAQRTNGVYTASVGPAVLDLAGNGMTTAATFTFNILTPPVIATQPASQTIVRNNNVSFSVIAAATPPVQYQWSYNGNPIPGATSATLTLANVQTNQSGAYHVLVTDAGGSVLSTPAMLTVLPTYGPLVAQAQAARVTVPAVPGNGVFIELFNGIGGGAVPAPSLVSNVTPSGTTLSPVIDFPHPGSIINVGSSFNNFFQDTTRPPDQVLGLSALNFILRNTFYLAVSRANDVHPETPEIDLRLGVGSDDGFYLLVGTNFIGSAGDRPFTYTWMDVSFQDEGLYPITLLYAANAVGQSGLEMSWQIGTNSATPIIPQSALYISPDLGDRLITFEEVPAGTVLSNQYAGTGLAFSVISGGVRVTTNFPTQFVPVTPPNVLGDPNSNPAQPGIIDLSFVAPGSTNRATSDFVSFFMLNAQNDAATVAAFDSGGGLLSTNSYHGGGASKELVSINTHGISRIRLNLGQGTNTAAIDNLAFLAPVSLPDLVVAGIQAPASVVAGQPVQVVWQVINQGFSSALGPWTDTVALSPNGTPGNSQILASVTYSNTLPPGASLTVTQSVIVPATQAGNRWFVITANSGHAFVESGSITNNTSVAAVSTSILAPDLAVKSLSAPASAQLGQAITVTWAVQNAGTASSAAWNDRLVLSLSSNSLVNPVILLTTPALTALPSGASYTNSQPISLPLSSSLSPGVYYLLVQADPDGAIADSNRANNLIGAPLTLSLPPLPDLVVGQVSSPALASAGDSITISWAVTNLGTAAAVGPWRETAYLVPAGVPQPLFATNPALFPLVGVFTYTNIIAAGSSLIRTQQISVPLSGVGGDLRLGIIADPDNNVFEPDKGNNAALAVNHLQVPVTLTLVLPVTNVPENTLTPNLPCLVSRNGDLTASVVVSLTSSATNHLQVPASVIIGAGAPSAPFTAKVVDDGVVGPDSLVTVTAQATGYGSVSSPVTVVDADLPRLSFSLATAQVFEGQTVTATVARDVVGNQPVSVSIASSSPTALSVPSSVIIPVNSNSIAFTLLAVQSTAIEPTHIYTITASAPGYASAVTNLTVFNNNIPTLTLALDRTNISEGDGPLAAVATVNRSPVTDQPVTVALASSNSAAATVPAQITIPGLRGQATFYVAAVNDGLITGPKQTIISARVLDVFSNPIGSPAAQLLVVQDDDGPALKVTLAPKVVPKGLNPAANGTVSRNTPPTNNLVVTLTSSATSEATVQPSVTISTGQTNATFAIASVNDGLPNSSHSVLITASTTNYASGSDALQVTDLGLPDLAISSISAPASGFTQEPLTIGFRLINQGLGALTNGVTQKVYLTTNASSGNNLLVGSVPFGGPLAPGQFVDQSVFVPGSALASPGTYDVVVTADADNAATELNEANNTTVSATGVAISAEYSAAVKAGVTNVPAGTPVPLTGSATLAAGGPAANKPVNILLTVRGLQRVFGVFTDTNGNFSTVFNPLPTEGGYYSVSAAAPGITDAPAQDHFTILGMSLNPASLKLSIIEGNGSSGSVDIENVSEVPLTGLTATPNGVAANLSVKADLSTNYLAGEASVTLSCTVSAQDASIRQSSFTIHLTSAEGAALDFPVAVIVQPLLPRLASAPAQLGASMLRGSQAIVQFSVMNLGGAVSGPLTVNLPQVPWLSLASTNPLPSLDPGASNNVTLLLTPAADLALGPYTGTLTVNGSGTALVIPFTFIAVSDAHGALRVNSTDEYTYFAPAAPPLTNASVSIIEPFGHTTVAKGVTDTNGVFFLPSLTEGTYEVDVTADSHTPFRGAAVVTAGQTNSLEAFLSRQTVRYTWTVVPTNIQDVTHITIQAEFEANVPAPVVVPNPTSLDLAPLDQPGKFMDVPLVLANYGLIAVQGVTISISQHPLYQFDLLTRNVGTLPAHGTVTVPMRITRLAASPQARAGEPCTISVGIGYFYLCGVHDVSTGIAIPVFNVTGDCGGGGGTIVVVGGGGGGTFVIPPGNSVPTTCDQCMAKAILECAIGYIPEVGDAYGAWSCGAGLAAQGVTEGTIETCVISGIGIVAGKLGGPIGGAIANTAACLWSFLRCKCPQSIVDGGFANCVNGLLGQLGGSGHVAKDATVGLGLSIADPRDVYAARSYPQLQFIRMIVGDTDGRWFSSGSGGAFGAWYDVFSTAVQTNSPSGGLISAEETAALLAAPRPGTVTAADVQNAIDRWNLTLNNWRSGIRSITNVPPGGNTNFIDLYALSGLMTQVANQYLAAQTAGYDSPQGGFFAALKDAESKLTGGGVCAHVVLQLDQDAVLTRDAFSATLQLDNGSTDPLMDVSVNLVVGNQAGEDVTALFGILPPALAGDLSGVDGKGLLPPNGSGSAQWTLIPTVDAAPQVQTNYLVSGTFSFSQNGVTITIPLAPSPITVQPSPQLYVKYFHQRDVFSDDPFTPEIEPSIPYSLAVLVQNHGYGVARDFKITSAQPKIVENEKGLLIDFKIIGAQVGSQPVAPTLTVDFGDVAAGQTKVGRWLLTSTLQGLFIDYKATFQHVDPLGNPRLSLIDGVEIHEMTHLVQAPGTWDDGLPDFLVNDVADFNNLPDTLYLSDGTKQPISVVQTATPDSPAGNSHLQVRLTANFPVGFTYLRVPDPGNGQFSLVAVQRANGTNFLANNFWTTDRTFIGLGQPPIRENILHLFDYHTNAAPDTYTLVYAAPSSVPQTNPPVSAVFSLPPHSPSIFGVVWIGANYVGQAPIDYFDIVASDNGSPFTLWQTHTRASGALYSGVFGHTYSFYSIATDTAGNVEAPPPTPDAVTLVDLTNTRPVIAFATNLLTINEGDALQLAPTVSDADLPPQTLSFSRLAGAPFGVTVDPATGLLSWTTPKGSGATTNVLGVVVTDNGFPALAATGLVTVVIKRVNSAPILAPIQNYTINEGSRLLVTNQVTDYDIPAQTFSWALGPGAPSGAAINPTNGIFSWLPTVHQGPSTNILTVIVTDSGVPPLSATQQFTVIVRHVLPDFAVSVGSTNILTGEHGVVPVTLDSTLDLTNVTFQLGASSSQLTNLTLQPLVAEVTSATLQPLGSNTYAATFTLNTSLQLSETRSLATLSFVSVSNVHSAIVQLPLTAPAGLASNGLPVAIPSGFGGRIIVVGAEPVLELAPGPALTLYGHPGAQYGLQYRTNLSVGQWLDFSRLNLSGRVAQVTNLPVWPPLTFYRSYEMPALGLQILSLGGPVFSLNLRGQPNTHYRVQTATNLNAPIAWSDLYSVTLTNSGEVFNWTNPGEPKRFFRTLSP
jgi:hypothetical protein